MSKVRNDQLIYRFGVLFPIMASVAFVVIGSILVSPVRSAENTKKELEQEQEDLGFDSVESRGMASQFYSLEEIGVDKLDDGMVVTVLGGELSEDLTLTIPDTLLGKPVVAIAPSSQKHSKVSHVILPDTIQVIGKEAFMGCYVQELSCPDSLISIESNAFSVTGVNGMTELKLNEGLRYIGRNSFKSNRLKTVEIPSTVEFIGQSAFYDNLKLSSITLKAGEQDAIIERDAFSAINFDTDIDLDIVIPGNYVSIGKKNFSGAKSITVKRNENGKTQTYNADGVKVNEFHGTDTLEIEGKFASSKTVIYGPEGSSLQAYAEENGYEFVIE